MKGEEKYRELAENITEGIYLTEKEVIKTVNTACARIFGYDSPDQLIGKRVWDMVKPETRERTRLLFIRKVKELDTSPVELQCIRRDGALFWAEIRMRIIKDKSKVFGVVSDISQQKKIEIALKESEKKYRSVVDAMNEGIVMFGTSGEVVTWNRAATRILGLSDIQMPEVISPNIDWKAIHEDLSPFPISDYPVVKTLESGIAQQDVIMGIYRSDGQLIWISINSEPIFDNSDPMPSAVVISFNDITKQKNIENQLRELNATKDRLFSIIAHDLKSPYNAQLGFLELLLEEDASYTKEKRQHFISMIYNSAKQSFALLDNLLIWSRIQTGKIAFNPGKISPGEIIAESIMLHQQSADIKQVKIITELCNDGLLAMADLDMTTIIVNNLLSNAIKFTSFGGIIKIGCIETGDGEIQFYIADNGVGISTVDQEKILRVDQNFTTHGTNNEKGTGLGLIISRDFVLKNNGKIWLESSVGKGSTFYFTLKKP
nr:PAS domain-containing sensor histidine kinase [Bacteroidota bacterium]